MTFKFPPKIRLETTAAAIGYTLASLDDFEGSRLRPGQIVGIVLDEEWDVVVGPKVDRLAVVRAVRAKLDDVHGGLTFDSVTASPLFHAI